MARQYWKDKHQVLVEKWLTADTREEFRIYSDLSPALNMLVDQITQRYFNIPMTKKADLKLQCITHVLISIKSKYDPTKQKAYTYLGTAIRNWYTDHTVRRHGNDRLDITNSDEIEIYDQEELYDDMPALNLEALLDRLKDFRIKVVQSMTPVVDKYGKPRLFSKEKRMIEVLDVMIEYATRFESFESHAVVEYVSNRTGFNYVTVGYYINILFGVNISLRPDEYLSSDENKKFSMVDDNYCPNQDPCKMRERKKRMGTEYNYF